ncbi:MAG: hypothetical protein K2X31_01165 [Sphingopyxis sp.]|nr:hypothetical protein [Sphingopyxis sp.]
MSKPKKGRTQEAPEVFQDEPTALPQRDERGLELDAYGLPIVGPFRVARLAELEMPDPNDDPAAWADQPQAGPVVPTETARPDPETTVSAPVNGDETALKEGDDA